MPKLYKLYSKITKWLHFIYLMYAIPMVFIAATITPSFQNPDEPNHFMRAEQISRFELLPNFVHEKYDAAKDSISSNPLILYPDKGGFKTDKGVVEAYSVFTSMQFNTHVKVNKLKTDSAKKIKWGSGLQLYGFGNTAIYIPVVYIMPALGIGIGKVLNLSVILTLYLSRLLNGLLAIGICFFALKLAKRSNILMFTVLLFPMTVALFASVSQDAILISCSFLLIAIIDNAEFNLIPKYRNAELVAIIILMSIIGMAKPPYALFAFTFLFLSLTKKQKAAIIGIPFLAILTWLYLDHNNLAIIFAPPALHINAKLQIVHILHHPLHFLSLYFKFNLPATLNIYKMFVGVLGWLDVPFSTFYYIAASAILCLGFILNLGFKSNDHTRVRIALLISVLFTTMAVMATQYITWTALDANTFSGMQGRYLLPIFPLLALSLSGNANINNMSKPKMIVSWLPLLFPIVTAISIVEALVSRYY
jgi:uncharacterized membrane protein